jgi:hypothetical protein
MVSAARSSRAWPLIAGALALILALLVARMLLGARAELRRAAQATERSDSVAVDRHLRRAIAYYLPGNPWVSAAVRRLHARARADGAGAATSLARWRALRGAILALRGATQPYAEVLDECNRRIATLTSVAALRDGALALRGRAGERALARRLARPDDPAALWTLIGLLGFIGWVLGASLLIARGLSAELAWLPRHGWPALAIMLLGMSAFIAGMALA